MKTPIQLAALCLCLLSFPAAATTYYVDINSPAPTPPYSSWSTAATNIQDAISETANGDLILVNPGVYQSGGYTAPDGSLTAVVVTNAVTLSSANGASATLISGSNAMRCVYLANSAVLTGFTLTNGSAATGGGVCCESTNELVVDCLLSDNTATNGGGAYYGTLTDCVISTNSAESEAGIGGGVFNSVLNRCTVKGNSAWTEGGGHSCVFNNCLIENNSAHDCGGSGSSTMNNCTIVKNASTDPVYIDCSLEDCTAYNCIISDNPPNNYAFCTFNYCCTTPLPGGPGNLDVNPNFVNPSENDFHLQTNSFCINAGNNSYVAQNIDIDGNPRIVDGTVDMGAYEYQGHVPLIANIEAGETNVVVGYPLNFNAIFYNGFSTNFLWDFGDGTVISNQISATHTWSEPGNYIVTLTALNEYSPGGASATLGVSVANAITFYVSLASTNPAPPYASWSTAAVNIQDAVNLAPPGSLVLVTNPTVIIPGVDRPNVTNSTAFYTGGGAYGPDGEFYRVFTTNEITVESVNGPASTYIFGYAPGSVARSIYLENGATLSGFTLTNDAQFDSIFAGPTSTLITNCVITGSADVNFGTLESCLITESSICYTSTLVNCSFVQGGSQNCALNSCIVSNNSYVDGGILNNCILVDNTNSGSAGGAAIGEPGSPLVMYNCILSNNVASSGGGVYNVFYGNTPNYLTNCILNNCALTHNFGQSGAGAAYYAELNNCLISNNTDGSANAAVIGGLLVNCTLVGNSNGAAENATLTNCLLVANAGLAVSGCTLDQCTIAQNNGTATMDCTLNQCSLLQNVGIGASSSSLNNCLIISNSVPSPIGRPTTGGGASFCELTNCVLAYNAATNGGGAYRSTLVNCTVIANTGVNAGGIYQCTANNCILYYNNNGDFWPNSPTYPLNYCCVSVPAAAYDIRNITNAPLFVNLAGGDYHLQSPSPCINSGNNAYISAVTTDFDGNPRIQGGTVDIGAYEYQTPTSVISYAYLQQYGLPTDGSVDFKNLDGTAFNVYQDWIAGLNPTNSASVLAMVTPVTTNTVTGIKVTWQSVTGISYFLQRSTNLVSQPPFTTIQSNITGQSNTTSYTDASATNNVPYFYRVGVIAP